MLDFNKDMIITGAEQRYKKDGTGYVIVHVLGDNGQTFPCMFRGDVNKVMSLEKMKKYEISFVVNVGRYTNISIIDIN